MARGPRLRAHGGRLGSRAGRHQPPENTPSRVCAGAAAEARASILQTVMGWAGEPNKTARPSFASTFEGGRLASRGTRTLSRGLLEQSPGEPSKERRAMWAPAAHGQRHTQSSARTAQSPSECSVERPVKHRSLSPARWRCSGRKALRADAQASKRARSQPARLSRAAVREGSMETRNRRVLRTLDSGGAPEGRASLSDAARLAREGLALRIVSGARRARVVERCSTS